MAKQQSKGLAGLCALVALLTLSFSLNAYNASALRQSPGRISGVRRLLQSGSHGNVLIDYIGASGASNLQFTDFPISSSLQYVLPLSFAIDADSSGNTQNGVFSPYWASSLTPDAALSFKQNNPNVKLVVSLAGFSQFLADGATRNVDWYDPPDVNSWISNAVNSISSLVSQYSLDGVDVDYENFPTGSTTFTTCIGGLISGLKSSGTISIASIAPFGATLPVYADLFSSFQSSIDYVNYQFYADGLASQADFVNAYGSVSASFDSSKLLASLEAGGRGLQGMDFIGAVQQLNIPGIMIFNVDNDKGSGFSSAQTVASFLSS